MREYFTYGSVRGAAGNGGPYRARVAVVTNANVLRRYPAADAIAAH